MRTTTLSLHRMESVPVLEKVRIPVYQFQSTFDGVCRPVSGAVIGCWDPSGEASPPANFTTFQESLPLVSTGDEQSNSQDYANHTVIHSSPVKGFPRLQKFDADPFRLVDTRNHRRMMIRLQNRKPWSLSNMCFPARHARTNTLGSSHTPFEFAGSRRALVQGEQPPPHFVDLPFLFQSMQ